jgi:hypothetical protein
MSQHNPFAGWTGAAPLEMGVAPANDFHAAISAAKAAHPHGASVTLYSPERSFRFLNRAT